MRRTATLSTCAIVLLAVSCIGGNAAAARARQPKRTASRTAPARPVERPKKGPPTIPRVEMTKQEESLCRVRVGDRMPAITLPQIGGKGETKLADLYGKKATVVVFWKTDRRMTQQQLADIGPDIVAPFGQKGVAVVGIAVKESEANAQAALKKAGITSPNLLDAAGEAFAQVGSEKLPRTYLLDPQGKILWFDMEYSPATRRELKQALHIVAGEPATATGK